MVRVGDRVHVNDRGYGGYGVVEQVLSMAVQPILVRYESGIKAWEFRSNVTLLRSPDIGPRNDIEVRPQTLETLITGFDTYARHHEGCDSRRHDVTGSCDCGYARANAQVNDIRKMVGL